MRKAGLAESVRLKTKRNGGGRIVPLCQSACGERSKSFSIRRFRSLWLMPTVRMRGMEPIVAVSSQHHQQHSKIIKILLPSFEGIAVVTVDGIAAVTAVELLQSGQPQPPSRILVSQPFVTLWNRVDQLGSKDVQSDVPVKCLNRFLLSRYV